MKIKLISYAIILICILSAVSAGLFSVYRSEGKILSDEARERIEAFIDQFETDTVAE